MIWIYFIINGVICLFAGGFLRGYPLQKLEAVITENSDKKAFIAYLESLPEKSENKIRWEAVNLLNELRGKK